MNPPQNKQRSRGIEHLFFADIVADNTERNSKCEDIYKAFFLLIKLCELCCLILSFLCSVLWITLCAFVIFQMAIVLSDLWYLSKASPLKYDFLKSVLIACCTNQQGRTCFGILIRNNYISNKLIWFLKQTIPHTYLNQFIIRLSARQYTSVSVCRHDNI